MQRFEKRWMKTIVFSCRISEAAQHFYGNYTGSPLSTLNAEKTYRHTPHPLYKYSNIFNAEYMNEHK